jgi:hypothetical protein
LSYVVQSSYTIDDIYKSIDEFNEKFYKEFAKDNDKFKSMFETLKKSKLLDLNKDPTDLGEETSIYLSSIINKYGMFNYNKINKEILEKIEFSDLSKAMDIFFNSIVKTNRHHLILNKDTDE